MMDTEQMVEVVRRNVRWFLDSGVMRPNDGRWGVAERLVVMEGNPAAEKIGATFPAQTVLAPGVIALEHRRPDCCLQAALLFDLASEALGDVALRTVANNLIEYLIDRSCLQDRADDSQTRGLWGWANPNFRDCFWTDDNAWVVVLLSALSRRGRPELAESAVATARSLHAHTRAFLDWFHERPGTGSFAEDHVLGLRLNPHWLGLVTLAFAHASRVDEATDYADLASRYYDVALEGPPSYDERSRQAACDLPWALSEYAYLALAASVVAKRFDLPKAREAARYSCDALLARQRTSGDFPAQHYETPSAAHLADLIYTQNWATLGLQHAARLFGEPRYAAAAGRSRAFLAAIQDDAVEPWFSGCWRGLYDTRICDWGGGDRYEGGQGSLYSGWTNAPISWAFLFEITGLDLFS